MSALPKAVRKQIAAADKMATDYYAKVAAAKGEVVPPVVDPAVIPDPASTPAPSEPTSPDVSSAPPSDPSPAAAVTAPTPLPVEEWEKKYKVLQGKYNAEVPRLTSQVRELAETSRNMREQLSATQSLLASLGTQQVRNNEPPTSQTPAAKKRLVNDEEIKQFGPDLYDFIKRAAAEDLPAAVDSRVESRLAPVASKVEQIGDALGSTQQRVGQHDREAFFSQLETAVPNWKQLNEDPLFLDWLDQVDPYSGYRRGELITQAHKNYDVSRVVAFFRGYLDENAVITPPANSAPASGVKPQKNLNEFVAPGAPKTGTTVAPDGSGKRAWTRAEVSKFYVDSSAGKYRMKPDEHKRIEAEIFAAQREGRIR